MVIAETEEAAMSTFMEREMGNGVALLPPYPKPKAPPEQRSDGFVTMLVHETELRISLTYHRSGCPPKTAGVAQL